MKKILVNGGKRLEGRVEVSGSKNAALPILFATILTGDINRIENLPDISDVRLSLEILSQMGAKIERVSNTTVEIDTRGVRPGESAYDSVRMMRGSTYILGAELGRFKYSRVGWPGGCDFGVRPIDQHIKAFHSLGAEVKNENGYITAQAERLIGAPVYLDIASVGATINAIMAACGAEGQSVIDNSAREPHVVDLANYLNSCGASIRGAGTAIIKVQSEPGAHLSGSEYAIIPDMIEAGTYMIAAAAMGGTVEITNVIPKHLEALTAKFIEMGIEVEEGDESVIVHGGRGIMHNTNVKTLPYPGFPTDMHPQMTVLLCLANGLSHMTENIFENRFRYVDELARMGANIRVEGRTAEIPGPMKLTGAPVRAVDLRAGAAMILAGLAAEGTTTIENIESIERGYDNVVGKLSSLGADIKYVE